MLNTQGCYRYCRLRAAAPPYRAHVKKVMRTTEVSWPHSPPSPPNISAIGTPPWPRGATPPHGHSTMSELPHSWTRAWGRGHTVANRLEIEHARKGENTKFGEKNLGLANRHGRPINRLDHRHSGTISGSLSSARS
jgi:hypothetical protein